LRIVLASSSPRRRSLLSSIGLGFEVVVPDVDESRYPDEDPSMFVERVARAKAAVVDDPDAVIIAADTTVVFEGRVLGKPVHPHEAISMLSALEGERHTVMTGLAVRHGERMESTVEISEVLFSPLTPEEIAGYVASGEPLDKAGSYGLGGLGAILVESVHGSPSNVIGLPLAPLARLLRAFGVDLLVR
jgi:septum formation protein